MLFLGQASNFNIKHTFTHLFAFGTKKDEEKLKKYFAKTLKVDENNVYLTINGRSAIALALKTLVPSDSEVIINGFTCYAVVQAVKAAKCTPVYADIDPASLHLEEKTVTDTLTKHPHAKAIILQNTLGIPIDIESIQKIAKKHHLVIIEDMAHCAGLSYKNGQKIGSVGDAACYSFGKGKQIDTTTGGALILKNQPSTPIHTPDRRQKLSDSLRARWYPLFGAIGRFFSSIHLGKFWYGPLIRIHFIQRAVDVKLDTSVRPAYWQDKLALAQLKTLSRTKLPIRQHFLVDDRSAVMKELLSAGYDFKETWYDVPVSPIRYYKSVHFPEKDCKNAVKISKHIINIPTYYPKEKLKTALNIIEEHQI